MSCLDPPKHGHGNEPDKNKIHRAFVYFKFARYFIIGIASYLISDTIRSMIAISMLTEQIEVKIWNSIIVSNDFIFYGNIVIAIVMAFMFTYMIRLYSKRYSMIRFMHTRYCDCDRKRWVNQ